LIYQLKKIYRKNEIVVSVTTKTGYEVANTTLKEYVGYIFFFPLDLIFSIKHIFKKINPSLIVINETDIWPNFLNIAKKKKIPVILINAKLSNNSIKFKKILKKIFLNFDTICVQTKNDKKKFQLLGYPTKKLIVAGNTKFDTNTLLFNLKQIKELKKKIGIKKNQKIILAGSTHKGEEIIIKEAFLKLKKEIKNLVLIIAPRNPTRGYEVLKLFKIFKSSLLSKIEKTIISSNDVIIIDKIGILNNFYAICDLAFVGGSLIKDGGHNPLEPASYSKPILTGNYINDFEEIYNIFLKSKGAVMVPNVDAFYNEALLILKDEKKSKTMGRANLKIVNSKKGAVINISEIIINMKF